jgi:hypothetical protein
MRPLRASLIVPVAILLAVSAGAVSAGMVGPAVASTLARSHPPKAAVGQVRCDLKLVLNFSPPLTASGGGTNPTVATGSLTHCPTTDTAEELAKGSLSGTFGSSSPAPSTPPLSCPGTTSGDSASALTVTWLGGHFRSGGDVFDLAPSTLTAAGEQLAVNSSGDIGLTIPGAGGSATTTGSFARSGPDGWSATAYSANTAGSFDSLCQRRQGISTVTLVGTITVGVTYGFNRPNGILSDGTDVWVTDSGSNAVTELDAATGAWIQTLSGAPYGFQNPNGLADDGTNIWVTDTGGDSVTEFDAATGAWVRTLSGGSYGFNSPAAIVFDGTHLWVANTNTVTEINPATGDWVQTLSVGSYDFSAIVGMTTDDSDVWVANSGGDSVTEFDAATGAWIRTLSGASYHFNEPWGVDVDGSDVWVTNVAKDSVTVFDADTGAWIRTLRRGYQFRGPVGITFDGAHQWVIGASRDRVTELDDSTLALVSTEHTVVNGNETQPQALTSDGTHVWLANRAGLSIKSVDSVEEFDVSSGGLQILQG